MLLPTQGSPSSLVLQRDQPIPSSCCPRKQTQNRTRGRGTGHGREGRVQFLPVSDDVKDRHDDYHVLTPPPTPCRALAEPLRSRFSPTPRVSSRRCFTRLASLQQMLAMFLSMLLDSGKTYGLILSLSLVPWQGFIIICERTAEFVCRLVWLARRVSGIWFVIPCRLLHAAFLSRFTARS